MNPHLIITLDQDKCVKRFIKVILLQNHIFQSNMKGHSSDTPLEGTKAVFVLDWLLTYE